MIQEQERIVAWTLLSVVCALAFMHWWTNYPPSAAGAVVVEGRAVGLEPRTRTGTRLITQDDVLTVDTGQGLRKLFVHERNRPYGMVLVGRSLVAQLDQAGWVMSLTVEGTTVIDFAASAAAGQRRFMTQTVFGVVFLLLLGVFGAARIGMGVRGPPVL